MFVAAVSLDVLLLRVFFKVEAGVLRVFALYFVFVGYLFSLATFCALARPRVTNEEFVIRHSSCIHCCAQRSSSKYQISFIHK